MIRVSTLTKPAGVRASCYRFGSPEDKGDESEYFPSFQSMLTSAKHLAAVSPNPPYQDAYHYLNFSIECFMKYIFCIIREAQWSTQDPDTFSGSIPVLYRRSFTKKSDKLSAGSFGHDIVLIMDEMLAATRDLNQKDFINLKKELASDRGSWVADRYKIRKHSQYKNKFVRRLRKFEAVLDGTLARFT